MDADRARWADAMLVATLVAVDPVGLGGACIRASHGPARDQWLDAFRAALPALERIRRVPSHISEGRLLGGLDLTATLRAGRPVAQRGLLAESDGGFVVLPMAERIPLSMVAYITAALDTGEIVLEREGLALRTPAHFGVIALDEGIAEDEQPRAGLLDRLAFLLDLSDLRASGPEIAGIDANRVVQARAHLSQVRVGDDIREALCAASMRLGIASIRASMMAVRAACSLAALDGRSVVSETDATFAARLVLAARATVLPETESGEDEAPEQDAEQQTQPPESLDQDVPNEESQGEDETDRSDAPIEDLVLAAAQAAIPRGLLERLRMEKSRPSRAHSNGRAGALRQSLLRGRPAGVRRGEPRAGVRLNLIETLRAAAPWQPLRRAAAADGCTRRIQIRAEDFHVTRYKQRTQTTTIFVVDASGSSALNRLAEAKGAVELLLADCYVRRDQVAVIAFRGRSAELLLPPTRSLVRAKRSLAGLPGGGGTPLAAGIDAGLALAEQLRRAGQTPALVLLTDGRANVARDGSGNRDRAETEARTAARQLRLASIMSLFIDTSARAQPQAERLATEMNAHYLPLPYADAAALSTAVRSINVPGRNVQ
ncbi:MAG: magnesium chelatase subunit D [Panacagrimonas sp.]